MSKLETEGKGTSEWEAMQWIKWVAGLLGVVAAAVTAVLPLSGAVEADSVLVGVFGVISMTLFALSGKSASDYTKSRTAVKVGKSVSS